MKRFLRKRLIKRIGTPPAEGTRGRRVALGAGLALLGFLGLRRLARGRRGAAVPAPRPEEARASRRIGLLLLLSTAAGIGLLVVYASGGQPQLEGTLLGVALGGMGFALVLWGKFLFPEEVVTEERGEHPSSRADRAGAERELAAAESSVTRRTFLVRLGLAAAAAFGAAMI
ncbi:MAG: hypothetical protein LC722_03860, partial [Actinobacteria bacterium]|nr:hypothetical protein [Actinomycetota bacterium]